MMGRKLVVVLLFLCACSIVHANDVNRRRIFNNYFTSKSGAVPALIPNITAGVFPQILDHFISAAETPVTFSQTYYVNSTFFDPTKGNSPVILLIGGESPVGPSDAQSNTVVEYAQQVGGLLFALEHRFYGTSSPFPLLNSTTLGYLNSAQALADLAYFQESMITEYGLTEKNEWIVFGCSYSGALAAWYRLKYPHLAAGANSGSSPVEAVLSFYQYDQVVSAALGEQCSTAIHNATLQIEALLDDANTTQWIKDQFECSSVTDNVAFLYVLADVVAFAAQYNSNFQLIAPLCHNFTTQTDLVQTYIVYATGIFNTFMGCGDFDITSFTDQTQQPSDYMRPWMWQSCDEFGYFQTAPANHSLRSERITVEWHLTNVCAKLFQDGPIMTPHVDWTNSNYGGSNIKTSNTVFINGANDPWKILSVTTPQGPTVPSIVIPDAAHCANWGRTRPTDPEVLTKARQLSDSYLNAMLNPCADCGANGVCSIQKQSDTAASSICVCYNGYEGDSCQTTTTSDNSKMVPWWGVLIAVIVCLVIGGAVGALIGARVSRQQAYKSLT